MNQDDIDKMVDNIPRLKWACRRGMLELDVLLSNFLEQGYPGLTFSEKCQFVRLLDRSDPELFDWLLGQQVAIAEFHNLIELIRHHARSRI